MLIKNNKINNYKDLNLYYLKEFKEICNKIYENEISLTNLDCIIKFNNKTYIKFDYDNHNSNIYQNLYKDVDKKILLKIEKLYKSKYNFNKILRNRFESYIKRLNKLK